MAHDLGMQFQRYTRSTTFLPYTYTGRQSITIATSVPYRPNVSSNDTPNTTTPQSTSARRNKTPTSSSYSDTFASNQNSCLNSFLFREFRNQLETASSVVVADGTIFIFHLFKVGFTNQTIQCFVLKYQTSSMAVVQQQLDSWPDTMLTLQFNTIHTAKPKRIDVV